MKRLIDPFKTLKTLCAAFLAFGMVTAASGANYYVSTTGDDASTTPTDPETPLKTLEVAVSKAAAGDTISVKAGTYALTNELSIAKAITLEGTGWQTCIISNTVDKKRAMSISSTSAVVRGFTITGGKLSGYNSQGSGVYLKGGKLEKCRVTGNQWGTMDNNRMFGYGIYLANANSIVTHCIIDHNGSKANTRTCGGGIYANAAAKVDNCLIANNESSDGNGAGGGAGIYLNANATFTNCTIVDNTTTTTGGGCYGAYGTFVNCLFYGNVAQNDANAYLPDLYTTSADKPVCRNCLFEKAVRTGTGNVTQDPVFSLEGDYTLLPSSLAMDGGDDTVYVEGDLDLAGNPRKRGSHVDAGCYESDPAAVACGFYVSTKSATAGDSVKLYGGATGFSGTPTYTWTVRNETTGASVVVPSVQEPEVQLSAGVYSVYLSVSDGETTKTYARENLISVGAAVCYVDPDATGTYPYDSADNAASTFEAAYAACAEGGEIVLAAKTIPLTAQISIAKALTVRGSSVRGATILKQTASSGRVAYLNHPNAMLANVTVTGGSYSSGAGVYVGGSGGFVTNCVITGNTVTDTDGYGALYMEAGKASDCIISKNKATGGRGFSAVKLSNNAIVERSIIDSNTTAGWSTINLANSSLMDSCLFCSNAAVKAGVLYYNGNCPGSGTMRNCTLTQNTCKTGVGGVDIAYKGSGLKFINCIIADNKTTTGTPDVLCVAEKTNSFINCFFTSNPQGATALSGSDAGFKDSDHGDFRLGASSVAINAGTTSLGLGDYDLDLNDRVRGDAVDIGCYEADPYVLSVAFSCLQRDVFLGDSFSITSAVTGVSGTPKYAWTIKSAYETITSDMANPTIRPVSNGWFTVSLTVTCDYGSATSTMIDYLHVAPRMLYVTANADNAEYPYDTPQKATPDMALAWKEAIDGVTIHVSGKIPLSSTLTVDVGATIIGTTGSSVDGLTRSGGTVVLLNHADAVLRGLTLSGGTRGVQIASKGGLVEDCVLTRNDAGGLGYSSGAGAYMDSDAAVIRRTIITDNKTSPGGGVNVCGGAGVYVKAGLLENCLIARNYCEADGNGVLILSPNVTLRNCTIANNTSGSREGGGLFIQREALSGGSAPQIVNCLIVSNLTSGVERNIWTSYVDNSAAKGPDYTISSIVEKALTTCAFDMTNVTSVVAMQIPTNSVNALIVGDPLFATNGTYRLQKQTPLRDCGTYQEWMAGATDLYGDPRCARMRHVGIGCCEPPRIGGLVIIVR